MINVGANRIVYGPVSSHCVPPEVQNVNARILSGHKIELIEFDKKIESVNNLLTATLQYIRKKTNE